VSECVDQDGRWSAVLKHGGREDEIRGVEERASAGDLGELGDATRLSLSPKCAEGGGSVQRTSCEVTVDLVAPARPSAQGFPGLRSGHWPSAVRPGHSGRYFWGPSPAGIPHARRAICHGVLLSRKRIFSFMAERQSCWQALQTPHWHVHGSRCPLTDRCVSMEAFGFRRDGNVAAPR
jgi:hypothetical protein